MVILDWTKRGLARMLARPESTVRQWDRGVTRIPDPVDKWLEARVASAEKTPPPVRDHA